MLHQEWGAERPNAWLCELILPILLFFKKVYVIRSAVTWMSEIVSKRNHIKNRNSKKQKAQLRSWAKCLNLLG